NPRLELRRQRGQREVAGPDGGDVGVARHQPLARSLDLSDLGHAERHRPVVAFGHLRSVPGRRTGLLGREHDSHGRQASQGKRGAKSSSLAASRKLSVALTRAARMPGSSALWPASGTTTYRASGQARARVSAVTGGQTTSEPACTTGPWTRAQAPTRCPG